MKTLLTLARGDSLNAWELSPVAARYFPGEPAPASDPQNYRYINGFVDVGDLPCRVATWAEVAGRTLVLDSDWPVESLYLPGRSRRVEFSLFCSRPTRLTRWCRTYISAEQDGYQSFRLSTRGGIHIWVDGLIAARFEPFTRNQTQHTIVHLPIKAGGSEVIVFMEEMAERDVTWFFELVLEDNSSLAISLPGASAETGPVDALKTLAAQVRPTEEVIDSKGLLALKFDDPAPLDVTISARITSTSHTHATLLDRHLTLPAGETELVLCRGEELPDGYHTVFLTFSAGSAKVERDIACAVLHVSLPRTLPGDLAARKRQALEYAVEFGEMRMGTALALFATGRSQDPRIRPILEETLLAIEERRDCADFIAVPLLWAYKRYSADFPVDLRQRTERALLDFRYWVDEPGNDVMWFWSENHALCFHVSQLLAGQIWPDGLFTASARTGHQQAALATQRLAAWFDAVEEDGLAEWNSAAYYPVDFIGLLALVEFAPTPLAQRASALCDRIFTMLALHTLDGVPAGSMGRAYDKELRAGPLTELAPFAAVAFGTGWLNSGVASLPMFAAGRYTPPNNLNALAFPPAGEVIETRYRQGHGPAALLALRKSAHLQLSTNSGAKAGAFGHQQHVLDIRFASHPMARAWINHPGEDDPWGQHRPSYWAGNGRLPRLGQHGAVAMLLYHLDGERLDFTHVYAARCGVEHHLMGDALILRSPGALVAFKATGPIDAVRSGPTAGLEYRCHGKRQGWSVIISRNNDLDDFAARIAACTLSMDTEGLQLTLRQPGEPDIALGWADGLSVAGAHLSKAEESAEPLISSTR
ncbi:MAG: hypothetical protein ABS76_19600 [Pelagibacterium sp. SCN 64-44]|nr:MAG: hypothetical protein ABS76_19600 [Pelagibacterium sp. SCN 64-44]